MSRLSRPLAFAMLALALTACDAVPNLNLPGQTLQGEVSGDVTSQTKVAITDTVPLDFSQAEVLRVSNGKFSYPLPDDKLNVFVAAFEDKNNNNKWDADEPISSKTSSYLKVSRSGSSWIVTEYTQGVSQSASLTDSTIAFNA